MTCPDGGIGRRVGLKHQWGYTRAGSTPALGTRVKLEAEASSFLLLYPCQKCSLGRVGGYKKTVQSNLSEPFFYVEMIKSQLIFAIDMGSTRSFDDTSVGIANKIYNKVAFGRCRKVLLNML